MSGAYWGDTKDFDGVPIDKDFFDTIGKIADSIGAALKKKGILVSQTKEKFGRVCVYVSLRGDQHAAYKQVYLKALERYKAYAKYIHSGMDYPELIGMENYCFMCQKDMPIKKTRKKNQIIHRCPHGERATYT